MPIYVIYDALSESILGATEEKDDVIMFKTQRNMKDYMIEKIPDRLVTDKLKNDLSYYAMEIQYNHILSGSEVEVFYDSLQQMLDDLKYILGNILKETHRYFKLTDDEAKIVDKFVRDCYDMLLNIDNSYEREDTFDFDDYLNMEMMVKNLLMSFGGKE